MNKLLGWLWEGCWHDWKFRQHVNYFVTGNNSDTPNRVGAEYECTKCGIRRKRRI